jgi:methylenetetrahydrofolate dehydrogenase (NADP+)/methenyltetrahydrofolate cyclohydrolase/formyltetrahydrofolate synthetase
LIPVNEFSMGLTGDIYNIMSAHNLAMVAMTSRMQHERNYTDEQLKRLTRMRRLNIDPTRVEIGWVWDLTRKELCEKTNSVWPLVVKMGAINIR